MPTGALSWQTTCISRVKTLAFGMHPGCRVRLPGITVQNRSATATLANSGTYSC